MCQNRNYYLIGLLSFLLLHSSIIYSQTTVKDVEGNKYNTVTIGKQVWMKENLKVTRYNDSTAIPLVKKDTDWYNLFKPGYCWYNNDSVKYANEYGALYNWYTVNTNKLCPSGWHVPTDEEWTILTTFIGGEVTAGLKLKEAGSKHWGTDNKAVNKLGFTALPGGFRESDPFGKFFSIGNNGYWWSSTRNESLSAWYRVIYKYDRVERSGNWYNNPKTVNFGLSVRCVKD